MVSSIVDVNRTAPNRVHHIINHLKKHHNVTVVCVNDWWKAKNSTPSYDGSLDGIEIRHITEKNIPPFAQEALSPTLIDLPRSKDFDVIFNYNTFVSGLYLSNKYDIPMIYDLADDMPEMICTSQQVPLPFRKIGCFLGKMMLSESLRASEKVSCISHQLLDSYKIPSQKAIIAPNGVDTEMFKPNLPDARELKGLDFKLILGYVGVLREWVNFTPLFDVLKRNKEIGMLVVGDEGSFRETVSKVKALDLNKQVHFSGAVNYSEVPNLISMMDVCTIPFIRNEVTHNAVPVKLFEYMACEKQVISSDLRGVREAVGDMIFYADTSKEISYCLNALINDGIPEELCKKNRTLVCEKYSWKITSEKIEKMLEETVEGLSILS